MLINNKAFFLSQDEAFHGFTIHWDAIWVRHVVQDHTVGVLELSSFDLEILLTNFVGEAEIAFWVISVDGVGALIQITNGICQNGNILNWIKLVKFYTSVHIGNCKPISILFVNLTRFLQFMILHPIALLFSFSLFIFKEKDSFAGFCYHYLVVVEKYHFKRTVCDLLQLWLLGEV